LGQSGRRRILEGYDVEASVRRLAAVLTRRLAG
jgi:hypothetical protein